MTSERTSGAPDGGNVGPTGSTGNVSNVAGNVVSGVVSGPTEGVAAETPIAFEQALRRLAEIVQTLERGDLPLEQSVLLFEEGVKLSVISQQRLDSAQKKVEELLGVDASGRVRTAPFSTRVSTHPATQGDEGEGRSE